MDGNFQGVFFVKQAPTYELIEDHVHVTYVFGEIRVELVLTRSRFLKAFRAARDVVETISKAQNNVVAFGGDGD